ncbi:hypothetical protein EVAR_59231_1 [Eumeta japonica]|uniref:Uncharacterized protein n=1 Tax=Eumeta variegata TaxID=151549 RepID=A0A4C1ZJU3_EUMVA|nr:hypothetical protein EVAR_59231_1 [Eumeta japonica]
MGGRGGRRSRAIKSAAAAPAKELTPGESTCFISFTLGELTLGFQLWACGILGLARMEFPLSFRFTRLGAAGAAAGSAACGARSNRAAGRAAARRAPQPPSAARRVSPAPLAAVARLAAYRSRAHL